MMQKGSKVAIVGCSNGQPQANRGKVVLLEKVLVKIGLCPVFSDFLFERDSVFSGTGRERAEALMNFYQDREIQMILIFPAEILRMKFYRIWILKLLRKTQSLFGGTVISQRL